MKKNGTSRHSAFTLVEILVVLAIIGILSAILFPAFSRAQEGARQTSCASNLQQIGLAVQQYFQDTRRYPDSLVDLLATDADYDGTNSTDTTPPAAPPAAAPTIARGTGYLKGGADILMCPNDEISDRPKSSYGAMGKSPIPPYDATTGVLPPTADAGRYVFNYWGYRKDGFILSSPAGVATEVGTTTPQPLLVNPAVAYDAANPQANPIKYSLSNRFAPVTTIITHCVYHRPQTANDIALPTDLYQTPTPIQGDSKGARDIVLRLDGSAKAVDVSTWNLPAAVTTPATPPQWQLQK